jgi:hypothetical protein
VLVEMPGGRCATCRWKREVVYMCMYVHIYIYAEYLFILYICMCVCAMGEISSYWDIYIHDTYMYLGNLKVIHVHIINCIVKYTNKFKFTFVYVHARN